MRPDLIWNATLGGGQINLVLLCEKIVGDPALKVHLTLLVWRGIHKAENLLFSRFLFLKFFLQLLFSRRSGTLLNVFMKHAGNNVHKRPVYTI